MPDAERATDVRQPLGKPQPLVCIPHYMNLESPRRPTDAILAMARRRGRQLADALEARSHRLVAALDLRMEGMIVAWIAIVVAGGVIKVALAPVAPVGLAATLVTLLPYLLIAAAPIAGYRLTAGSFPTGLISAQPLVRLCWYGTWRKVDPIAARQSPSFGPSGFMASLLAGILLNVPFRSFEFMLSIPAMSPGSPVWATHLMVAMTADVVIMNFFYMVCFVMALRSVPLFPRMLLFAWLADVTLQFGIAHYALAAPGLPASVASGLQVLLDGNLKKVMISAFVWLPYLILSERVNLTFRQRVRAA